MHSIFVLCEDSYKEKVKAYFKFEEDKSSMDTGVQESGADRLKTNGPIDHF